MKPLAAAASALAVALAALPAAAQPAPPLPDWKDWTPLIGEWEADPAPNGATGAFTLEPSLGGRVLQRKNRADYPKQGDRPAAHHEDLMIVHRDGDATPADYWDSEGHVIHYTASVKDKTFTFLSDAAPGQPRFRLTYVVTGASASLRFEIAPPGAAEFKTYIQASVHRKR